MLAKNLPIHKAIPTLFLRGILDTVSIGLNLIKKDWRFGKAVIQAHVGFYHWLLFHRKQAGRVTPKNLQWEGYFKGSILWQFYMKGRRRFSEIILQNK